VGLGGRINMIMQTAFFKLANVIPVDEAIAYLKDQIKKMFGKKGDRIVKMNNEAVDKTLDHLVKVEVPGSLGRCRPGGGHRQRRARVGHRGDEARCWPSRATSCR
jgi:ABC-type dipeptide/oligopeptide/nickel transport system ATPase component